MRQITKCGLRGALTALAMGLCAMGLTAKPAQAQIDPYRNPFATAASWQGFAWDPSNAAGGVAGLAIWNAQPTANTFNGGLSLFGRGRIVSGHYNTLDGSVDIAETMGSAPLMLHGMVVPTAQGGYIGTMRVMQLTRNLGTIKMLWLRKQRTPAGFFPPGPCLGTDISYTGRFQGSDSDSHGLIALLFDPQRGAGDNADPPSIETGALMMQNLHCRFVATIDPNGRDGAFNFDLLAQTDAPSLPAVQLGGTYLTDPITGKQIGFQGGYQLFNSMFNVFSRGSFSAFAP